MTELLQDANGKQGHVRILYVSVLDVRYDAPSCVELKYITVFSSKETCCRFRMFSWGRSEKCGTLLLCKYRYPHPTLKYILIRFRVRMSNTHRNRGGRDLVSLGYFGGGYVKKVTFSTFSRNNQEISKK